MASLWVRSTLFAPLWYWDSGNLALLACRTAADSPGRRASPWLFSLATAHRGAGTTDLDDLQLHGNRTAAAGHSGYDVARLQLPLAACVDPRHLGTCRTNTAP